MGSRTYKDVAEYVERQSQYKCKARSAKPEQHFNDLGDDVTVWNVKTDTDGTWWVVAGDTVPMNLYPQSAYYLGTDEAYSFHMGIMQRMQSSREQYNPDDYIEAATLSAEIAPQLLRKQEIRQIIERMVVESKDEIKVIFIGGLETTEWLTK